jgi:hypothetical protein
MSSSAALATFFVFQSLSDPIHHLGQVPGGGILPEISADKTYEELVGTGRFELPTPRTPSECSTRLSHVPTLVRTGKFERG